MRRTLIVLVVALAALPLPLAGQASGSGEAAMVHLELARARAQVAHQVAAQALTMEHLQRAAVEAPAPWAPQDPADSLYRAARAALNGGQYRTAGDLFAEIISRHPRSAYAGPAHYYQALALSRLNDVDSLRRAREVLERMARRQDRTTQQIRDAEALRAQIDAQLAERGDPAAARRTAELADKLRAVEEVARVRQDRSCEDDEVRMIALQGVMRTNPEGALPVLRELLARTDECAEEIQGYAFMLLGQSSSPEAQRILAEAARSARSPETQAAALVFMSQSNDPAAVDLALELLRSSTDEDVHGAALMTLQRSRTPRARDALREFIRRPGADEDTRAAAVVFLGQSATEEDIRFLRELYPSVQEEELKQAILVSLMQRGGDRDVAWLMEIAMNPREDEDVRQMALMSAAQSKSVTADHLVRIYEGSADQDMKQHVVMLLSQRVQDPQAVEKLLAIARDNSTEPDIRRHVILMLSQSKDPKVQQALLEIIRK